MTTPKRYFNKLSPIYYRNYLMQTLHLNSMKCTAQNHSDLNALVTRHPLLEDPLMIFISIVSRSNSLMKILIYMTNLISLSSWTEVWGQLLVKIFSKLWNTKEKLPNSSIYLQACYSAYESYIT